MNQNVNHPNSEVVYLIPCKEKHTASQINCAGKAKTDFMKISLNNVSALDLPIATVGDMEILKKLKEKRLCNQGRDGLNQIDNKDSPNCVLNSGSYILPPTSVTWNRDLQQNQSKIDSGFQLPIICKVNSITQVQFESLGTNQSSNNRKLDTHDFTTLPEVADQDYNSSKGKAQSLSDTVVMSSETPVTVLSGHTDTLGNCVEGERANDMSCSTVKSESQQDCMPFFCDISSTYDLNTNKQNMLTGGKTELKLALGSSTVQQSSVCGLTSLQHKSLPTDLVWNQQTPKSTVVPLTSSANNTWTCEQENAVDDLLNSFQELPPQYFSHDEPSICGAMSWKSNTALEKVDANNGAQVIPVHESQGNDLLFEMSKLESVLKLENTEPSTVVYKEEIDEAAHFSECLGNNLMAFSETSHFEKEVKKPELSNVNDLISDVADILDEFQCTTTKDSKTVMEAVSLHDHRPSASSGLDEISSNEFGNFKWSSPSISSEMCGKPHLSNQLNTALSETQDFSVESMFQTAQNLQTVNENKCESIDSFFSSEVSNNRTLQDSSKKCESDMIFNDLIMSKDEYQNSSRNHNSNASNKFDNSTSGNKSPSVSKSCSGLQARTILPKSSCAVATGIPKRVAFKVRPAGKPVRSFDKGRVTEKVSPNIPRLLHSTLDKDRSLRNGMKSQFHDGTCSKNNERNHVICKRYVNQRNFSQEYLISCKYFALSGEEAATTNASLKNARGGHELDNVILPVGKTGLSIAIPNTAKTNVISFLPTVSQICKTPSKTSSSPSYSQCQAESNKVSSVLNTSRLYRKPPLLQYIKPNVKNPNLVMASPPNSERLGSFNQVIQQTILKTSDAASPVTPSAVITFPNRLHVVDHISVPQTGNCKPLYMMVPATTHSLKKTAPHNSLPLTSILTQAGTLKTKSINTLQLVEVDSKESLPGSKQYIGLKSSFQPIAPKGSQRNNASCAKTLQDQGSVGIPEPIRITIRTKPKVIPTQVEYAPGVQVKDHDFAENERSSGVENKLERPNTLNMKLFPGSSQNVGRNRNFVNELKVHFPSVPESIFQQLTIPPQALHRGYLTRHDLQNLQTQAMKLNLSIIYRNHVSKCTTFKCEICRNFVGQQDTLSWTAREKLFKPKRLGRNHKSKRGQFEPKKSGRKCILSKSLNGEEDDPTYKPPSSYFKSWKRKTDSFWCNRQPMKLSKMENGLKVGNMTGCCILLKPVQQMNCRSHESMNTLQRSISEPSITRSVKHHSAGSKLCAEDDIGVTYAGYRKSPLSNGNIRLQLNDDDGRNIYGLESVFGAPSRSNGRTPESPDGRVQTCETSSQLHLRKDYGNGNTLQPWQDICQNQCCSVSEGLSQDGMMTTHLPISVGYPYAAKSATSSQMTHQPVPLNNELQFSPAVYLEKGCSCIESCRTMQCPCARAGVLCRAGLACLCKNCDNPLNVLHQYELDVLIARVDECLMQNLYSYDISDLCKMLLSDIVLPCCKTSTKLQHIIPSTVICNCCGNAVSYSWCTHTINLQTLCPRNHCLVCCACKPALHTHCQRCQQCTPSAGQGTCTECGVVKLFPV